MPFCHNCGAKLEPGDMFCIECGTKSKEFISEEVRESIPENLNNEKVQETVTPQNEKIVEAEPQSVSENSVVASPMTENAQHLVLEPENEAKKPSLSTIEPDVDSQIKSEQEAVPELEESSLQTEESIFVEFNKETEVKTNSNLDQSVESAKNSKSDPDFYIKGDETKAEKKQVQDKHTEKNNLIPLMVTISAICVAVIVALVFAILIILKKDKNNKEQNNTETVNTSYYSESIATETTIEETTTESTETETTEESEEPEDTEDTDETEDDETTSSAKTTTAKKPKIKVTNAVNKKLDAAQYGTYVFKIPKVTISGVNTDEANKKIKDDLSQYLGVAGEPFEVTHTHYSNKTFVVVLVSICKHHPYSQTRVYTISLKTGKIMTGSEIVKIYGITDKHFFRQVRTTYNKCSFFGGATKAEEDALRKKNLKRVSFKYISPYISKKGHLCFVAYCDYFGIGSPGYLNFDATAKKMI